MKAQGVCYTISFSLERRLPTFEMKWEEFWWLLLLVPAHTPFHTAAVLFSFRLCYWDLRTHVVLGTEQATQATKPLGADFNLCMLIAIVGEN